MALAPKSAVLQLRVDPRLLDEFRILMEMSEMTVSEAIRRYMRHVVALPDNQKILSKDKQETDIPVIKKDEMTRQQRRALERAKQKGR